MASLSPCAGLLLLLLTISFTFMEVSGKLSCYYCKGPYPISNSTTTTTPRPKDEVDCTESVDGTAKLTCKGNDDACITRVLEDYEDKSQVFIFERGCISKADSLGLRSAPKKCDKTGYHCLCSKNDCNDKDAKTMKAKANDGESLKSSLCSSMIPLLLGTFFWRN